MNREIKFRVWDKKNNCWLQQLSLGYIPKIVSKDGINSYFDEIKEYHLNNEDLVYQQFTGIKDINNKEIYEGDIVKIEHKTRKYEISHFPIGRIISDGTAFLWHPNQERTGDDSYDNVGWWKYLLYNDWNKELKVEVIGNIHENLELLEIK